MFGRTMLARWMSLGEAVRRTACVPNNRAGSEPSINESCCFSHRLPPPQHLVVRAGVDGCPTYWQIVNIANWGKSPQEAADASMKNDVLFIIDDEDVACSR